MVKLLTVTVCSELFTVDVTHQTNKQMPLYDYLNVDLGLNDQFKQAGAAVIFLIAFISDSNIHLSLSMLS